MVMMIAGDDGDAAHSAGPDLESDFWEPCVVRSGVSYASPDGSFEAVDAAKHGLPSHCGPFLCGWWFP